MAKRFKLVNVELTRSLYEYIKWYATTYQCSPSFQEMADACYTAPSTISRHLDRLEMAWMIERVYAQKRNIRLTKERMPTWLAEARSFFVPPSSY